MAKVRKPKKILEELRKKVLVNGAGQRVPLTTQEHLLHAILEVLVYQSEKK
jgi:hypothetical protein